MFADLMPDEEPQATPQAVQEIVKTREKILLVDDDPTHLEILKHGLEFQGFDVVAIECGEDLFSTIQECRPDAVILDIYLPDANGLEICQELADAPATATIPVIILSGSVEKSVVRQARTAGCRYFISKPFDPNTILIMIRQAIDEGKML